MLLPSASPAYLYYAGLVSFPANLLLEQARGLALPSLSVGTSLGQVVVPCTLVGSAPTSHN